MVNSGKYSKLQLKIAVGQRNIEDDVLFWWWTNQVRIVC